MVASISDAHVWRSVKTLYVGSATLFLVTVLLGILNVFTQGELPRGQALAHFHSGTIGWVTLSVLATTVWLFTGSRSVGDAYRRNVRVLAWAGIVAVAGYVSAFYIAFNNGDSFWMLPLFGIPAALVILGGLVLAATQLRRQETVTNAHVLMLGALLVAGLGATMGVLVGLGHADVVDAFPDNEDTDPVGAHAGPMDMYLALAFGAVVELLLRPGGRWTKPGLTQMALGVLSGYTASAALFFGVGALIPVALLLFLASFGFYIGRTGWRTFRVKPLERPSLFWGGFGLPAYILFFVYIVNAYYAKGDFPPHVLEVAFVHTTFVFMATNLVLTIQSAFSGGPTKLENVGVWLLNAGFLVFLAGEVMAERREGALVMAAGVLLAVWVVVDRTWRMHSQPPASM